jgi:hypothetical protein
MGVSRLECISATPGNDQDRAASAKGVEFFASEFAIAQYLIEQARADGFAGVDGHCRHTPIAVAKPVVAAMNANDLESGPFQGAD